MKRSKKLHCWADKERAKATMTISAACAVGVWAVRAWQSTEAGGALVLAVAFIAFRLGLWHASECRRLRRLARNEQAWEGLLRP